MKKLFYAVFAALFALCSCQMDELAGHVEEDVLYVKIEESSVTKTYMGAGNKVLWSEGDQIVAFMKSYEAAKYQVSGESVGNSSAVFTKVSGSGSSGNSAPQHNVAFYPYSFVSSISKSGNNYVADVNVPSVQTYSSESFDDGFFPMAAVSKDNTLSFRNICGAVNLRLTGSQKVKSVTLNGNSGEKISGSGTLTVYPDNSAPYLRMKSSASSSVTLDCGSGVQLNEDQATSFVIVLPPVQFSQGFTITVTDSEGTEYEIKTDKSNSISRSNIHAVPVQKLGDDFGGEGGYSIINYSKYYNDDVVYAYDATVPALADEADFNLVYNSSINIIDSLETYAVDFEKALPEINVEPTYVVSLAPATYVGADGKTNQQKFVKLAADGTLTVDAQWLTNGGRAAIGRTPVVKVSSFVNNVEVAVAYVKVIITDEVIVEPEKPVKPTVTFITKTGEYEYANIKDETLAISWEEANAEIFEVLGMSYEQFFTNYNVVGYRVEPAVIPAGVSIVCGGNPDKTVNFLKLHINNKVLENVTGTVTVVFPAVDPTEHESVAIDFVYTVSHNHVWPEFNPDYLLAGETNTVQVKGKKINGTWAMISELAEHFKNYDNPYLQNNHVSRTIALDDATVQTGAAIGEFDGKLAIYLTEPLTVNSKDYVVKMTDKLANGSICSQLYTVRFVSPFEVSLEDVELKTLIADADAENLNAYLSVKDAAGNAIVTVDKNNNLVLTEAATTLYGLTAVPTVSYALVYAETGNDTEASFGGNLNLVGENVIWDNDGTDLLNNKVAKYTATVTFKNICELTEEANVTVLSTANSEGQTSPNLAQWVYFDADYDTNIVVDFGVSANGKIRSGVEMDGAWYEQWNVPTYKVMPTSATAGVITSTVSRTDRYGDVIETTYTIAYSNLTDTTVDLLSYSDVEKNLVGLGIMKFDENWNVCPVTATKATTVIEFTEMGNEPGGMEPLSK